MYYQNEIIMKNTINKTRLQAIGIIENVITLQYNVDNGCYSDRIELDSQKKRLEGIKRWAKDNDQLAEITHFFASSFFGNSHQFIAQDLAKFFNN